MHRNFFSRLKRKMVICVFVVFLKKTEKNSGETRFIWKGAKDRKCQHSVVSNSFRPHRLLLTRLLCPWNSPGKNTEVGCHSLLQGIFPNQVLNLSLPPCRQILYHLSHREEEQGGIEPEGKRKIAARTLSPRWEETGANFRSVIYRVLVHMGKRTLGSFTLCKGISIGTIVERCKWGLNEFSWDFFFNIRLIFFNATQCWDNS